LGEHRQLEGLKSRGFREPPALATGDGAPGFWMAALRDVYPDTREQCCWVHKTSNVLGAMPKSVVHERARADLQDISMAQTQGEANAALDLLNEACGVKYEKAAAKLGERSRRVANLLRLSGGTLETHQDDQPDREHLRHCANRTRKTKGGLSCKSALCMVFRLMMSARKKWRKISDRAACQRSYKGLSSRTG